MVTVDGKDIDFKKIFLRLVSFVSILSPNNFGFSITTP
jgi:hypothetical protein